MKKILYVVLTLLAIASVAVYAQQPKAAAPAGHEHHMMAEGGEHHCDMTAANKEMTEKMNAMDTKLQSLVAAMNSAAGSGKVDAMSAVINELVAQRTQMRTQMMSMHGAMSGCCMKKGDAQHAAGGMKGMEGCPMHKATK